VHPVALAIVVNQRLELLRTLTMTIECIDSLYLLILFYLLTFVLSVNFAIYLILGIVLHFMYLGTCSRTKETHNTTMYFLSKVLKGSSVSCFLLRNHNNKKKETPLFATVFVVLSTLHYM
jgi:hypothetical protein